jgi:hypothetical protein
MSLIIKANTFTTKRYLEVHSGGVVYCETSAVGGRRTFTYQQIECVLLSPASMLSFQVGNEVFAIPINQGKMEHRQAVEALLDGVQRPVQTGGFPVSYPSGM